MNQSLQMWIEQITHEDDNLRSQAVLHFGELGGDMSVAILIDALKNETDLAIQEDICFALVKIGSLALPDLIDLLLNLEAPLAQRRYAAHTLSKMKDAAAVEALIKTLADPDRLLKNKVIYALGQIGDTRAVPPLVDLLGVEDLELRATLADVLLEFGEAALPLLITNLHNNRWPVREQAADILSLIADERAVEGLSQLARDYYWEVRFAAVNALASIEGPAAQEALKKFLLDPDPKVSRLAARFCG
ncbi:hypothetical protein MASR2M15_06810 [Anaerolineales bacterium]